MSAVTNHVAEVAVPGQLPITVRAAQGELEIGQEYDGERHGIYVQPDNVLRLIRSMLRMIGMEDVHLYEQKPGGLCTDVDWPDGPFRPEMVSEDFDGTSDEVAAKQKDRTAAERQRRCRARKRDAKRDTPTVTPRLPLTNGHHQEFAS